MQNYIAINYRRKSQVKTSIKRSFFIDTCYMGLSSASFINIRLTPDFRLSGKSKKEKTLGVIFMANFRKLAAVILFIIMAFVLTSAFKKDDDVLNPAGFVAHGAGGVYGERITNSLEALEESYDNGFRFFEVDVEKTTDGKYILLHDWGRLKWLYNSEPEPCSMQEFLNLKMVKGLTQLTLDGLMRWMQEHSDAYAVIDAKSDGLKVYKYIKDKYLTVSSRVIPQAMSFEEYAELEKMGYKHIILTLYRKKYTAEQILEFEESHPLFAVTMYKDIAKTELPAKLKERKIFLYAHTINDPEEVKELKKVGIDGFYTDFLNPDGSSAKN